MSLFARMQTLLTYFYIFGQFEDSVQNECTSQKSQSSLQVKGALSLPDRILLNTGVSTFAIF